MYRRLIAVVAALAVVFGIAAIPASASAASKTVELVGHLRVDGKPVHGIQVSVIKGGSVIKKDVTDDRGYFRILVRASTYRVRFSSPDGSYYSIADRAFSFPAGTRHRYNPTLIPVPDNGSDGRVKGHVRTSNDSAIPGEVIPGAIVSLTPFDVTTGTFDETRTIDVITGQSGRFGADVPAGSYGLRAIGAPGKYAVVDNQAGANVVAGESVKVNKRLDRL